MCSVRARLYGGKKITRHNTEITFALSMARTTSKNTQRSRKRDSGHKRTGYVERFDNNSPECRGIITF